MHEKVRKNAKTKRTASWLKIYGDFMLSSALRKVWFVVGGERRRSSSAVVIFPTDQGLF